MAAPTSTGEHEPAALHATRPPVFSAEARETAEILPVHGASTTALPSHVFPDVFK
jgi:hypothetical protein